MWRNVFSYIQVTGTKSFKQNSHFKQIVKVVLWAKSITVIWDDVVYNNSSIYGVQSKYQSVHELRLLTMILPYIDMDFTTNAIEVSNTGVLYTPL